MVPGLDNGSPDETRSFKALTPGTAISHYKILGKIGEGGMGVVYKARDTRLDRTVALKFLPPHLLCDSEARERFIEEAQAASALDPPNICTIHEIGETDDGRMYIAMAYYGGESLGEKTERGLMEFSEAIDIAAQVTVGLSKAHGKGIVHRDIKPARAFLAASYLEKGITDKALELMEDLAENVPDKPKYMADLACIYARTGNRVKAEELFEELKVMSERMYVPSYELAQIAAGLGRKDEVFMHLDMVLDELFGLFLLKVDPLLDDLRSDPRFTRLLQKAGLAE